MHTNKLGIDLIGLKHLLRQKPDSNEYSGIKSWSISSATLLNKFDLDALSHDFRKIWRLKLKFRKLDK